MIGTTSAARRRAALLSFLAAFTLPAIYLAPAAQAHDVLTGSSPEDGETLDSVPEEVTLTFSNEIGDGGNGIVVTGPGGEDHVDGDVVIDGDTASADLLPLEEAGEYTVGYRIISADGHPVEEELTFTLPEDVAAEAAPVESESPTAEQSPTENESPAAGEEEAPADPMASMGPIIGVIAAIAVAALVVILIVRMRSQRGGQG
ncbi:hypothetical protein HDA32_000380 [Spinactinospora alkalitolerans]|uniref:CopC domain-containing protein n=1 Tax=Spinactinospora alkalitolerans TaxID=687207 RepID=A0A852TTJ5_9ACTN|nr:copper resistance CopC family protein [Spinactinospora alkalitolerans]NYE45260.1 hypothetical protein [Spinactinospora alkalitolerans]